MLNDPPRRPPAQAIVHYNGVPYIRDVAKCRNELTRLQAAGEVGSIGDFARHVGVSRSTAERFLNGWVVSMSSTMKILVRLGLQFEDVHAMQHSGTGEPG